MLFCIENVVVEWLWVYLFPCIFACLRLFSSLCSLNNKYHKSRCRGIWPYSPELNTNEIFLTWFFSIWLTNELSMYTCAHNMRNKRTLLCWFNGYVWMWIVQFFFLNRERFLHVQYICTFHTSIYFCGEKNMLRTKKYFIKSNRLNRVHIKVEQPEWTNEREIHFAEIKFYVLCAERILWAQCAIYGTLLSYKYIHLK